MLINLTSVAQFRISGMVGCYNIKHFSGNHLIGIKSYEDESFEIGNYHSYGVCDSPQQFMEDVGPLLEKSDDKFVAFFTHVAKRPGERDGWRWHKWGEYIGKGTPTREYLDDEEQFNDGIYVYHVYRVNNVDPHYVPPRDLMMILNFIAALPES